MLEGGLNAVGGLEGVAPGAAVDVAACVLVVWIGWWFWGNGLTLSIRRISGRIGQVGEVAICRVSVGGSKYPRRGLNGRVWGIVSWLAGTMLWQGKFWRGWNSSCTTGTLA